METAILIISALILIAVWNGFVIMWKQTNKVSYSESWHIVGFIVRALLVVAVVMTAGNFIGWLALIVSWHFYDVIINLIMKQKWNYTGKTAKIDKMGKVIWVAKVLILVAGIYFLF